MVMYHTKRSFIHVRTKLEHIALHGGYRKHDGQVYEPIKGCPCAFKPWCTYMKFIAKTLKGCMDQCPCILDKLVKHMTDFDMLEMPWLNPDMGLLSFSNCVLDLTSGDFTSYDTMEEEDKMQAACNHIPLPYTGSTVTPLLDKIFSPQFEADVAEILCALLGRLLFPTGHRDHWNVLPYLVGVGGSGKSTLAEIMRNIIPRKDIGGTSVERCSLPGLLRFQLIIADHLSSMFPSSILRIMASSDKEIVWRQNPLGGQHFKKCWATPVLMIGNEPVVRNTHRRVISIPFETQVYHIEDDLAKQIVQHELPNVVCRILSAYSRLITRAEAAGGFWAAIPQSLRKR